MRGNTKLPRLRPKHEQTETALTLFAPGARKLAEVARGVGLEKTKAGHTPAIPAEVVRVVLVRQ